jgi:hypothetical protein
VRDQQTESQAKRRDSILSPKTEHHYRLETAKSLLDLATIKPRTPSDLEKINCMSPSTPKIERSRAVKRLFSEIPEMIEERYKEDK